MSKKKYNKVFKTMNVKSGNKFNPERGRLFQEKATNMLSKYFNTEFFEVPVEIGNPPKKHKFDLVSKDQKYFGECKNLSWTKSGNIPIAKMAVMNEAVLYLSHIPENIKKFIVMRKDVCRKRKETLAEYYCRTYRHLLRDIFIIEIDIDNNKIKEIK